MIRHAAVLAVALAVAAAVTVAAIACGGGSSSPPAASSSGGASAGAGASAAATGAPDGVVLITIDTLRADRVGAYGWRAARTPAIDALAARGVRAERAYATAPITLTSHASLLTGLYPPHHGARHNGMRLRGSTTAISGPAASGMAAPGTATSGAATSGTVAARAATLGVATASTAAPSAAASGTAAPGAAASGSVAARTATSGVATASSAATPSTATPGTAAPRMSTSGAAASRTAASGAGVVRTSAAKSSVIVPTLAELLRARGFATGAFVAAFPLDRRFGLDRGFDVYSDALPRGADGRPRNERPGREVVDEAIRWLAAHAAIDPSPASPARPTSPTSSTSPGASSASGAASALAPGAGDAGRTKRPPFFLWVHLFEPHAPYEGDPASGGASRSASDRYDDEVARADAQVARIVQAIEPRAASTLVVVAGDHGEAFGEHGELGHSVFVYDTTLRVPLVIAGAGVTPMSAPAGAGLTSGTNAGPRAGAGRVIAEPVSLVDVMPTILDLLGQPAAESDGISLVPMLRDASPSSGAREALARRAIYAESFAPLLDFGWSPLRAVREGNDKYIAAPRPELYDLARDPGETHNELAAANRTPRPGDGVNAPAAGRAAASTTAPAEDRAQRASDRHNAPVAHGAQPPSAGGGAPAAGGTTASATAVAADRANVATALAAQVDRFSPADLPAAPGDATDSEALARLRSLGYLASSSASSARSTSAAPASASSSKASGTRGGAARPDPKDRIELASRIAEVTSGELQGAALRTALERLVRDDPRNGQMRMRLGFVLLEASACRDAVPHFDAAINAGVPSAEPHLGLAECLAALGRRDAARRALIAADRVEPGNPIVAANLGMMALEDGRVPEAIQQLRTALTRTPDLHQARFALARAYGRAGQRAEAAREARELLARLPVDAPQRAEVERLLATVQ